MINKAKLNDGDAIQFAWSDNNRGYLGALGRYDRLLDVIYNDNGRFPYGECTDLIKLVPEANN